MPEHQKQPQQHGGRSAVAEPSGFTEQLKGLLGANFDKTAHTILTEAPKLLSKLNINEKGGKDLSAMDWITALTNGNMPKEAINVAGFLSLLKVFSELAQGCKDCNSIINQLVPAIKQFITSKQLEGPVSAQLQKAAATSPLAKQLLTAITKK